MEHELYPLLASAVRPDAGAKSHTETLQVRDDVEVDVEVDAYSQISYFLPQVLLNLFSASPLPILRHP